jgi:hypothetical protein
MLKRFILYLVRWQLSTPILAPIIAFFKHSSSWFGTPEDWLGAAVANLIGGAIFFWVDRFIFTSSAVEVWNFKDKGKCDSCGKEASLWRLVKAPNYDKTQSAPVFLCMECSKKKTDELRKRGLRIRGKSQ